MSFPLLLGLECFGILVLVALMHELGHLYMLRKLNKKGIIAWEGGNLEINFDATNLSKTKIASVYLAGFVSGLLPLTLFLALPLFPWAWFILGLLVHCYLCKYDLEQLGNEYNDQLLSGLWLFLGWPGLGVVVGIVVLFVLL